MRAVDPFVQEQIVHTNGLLYRPLVGRLPRYPIPRLRLPDVHPDQRVSFLDIGCNWGRWCVAAAEKGYWPTGIDPRDDALAAAQRVARDHGIVATFVRGISEVLPFVDRSFDVVFSYSVLQFLEKDRVRRTVGEIRRVLKPGGLAMVQMANRLGIRCLYQQARRPFRRAVKFEVRYWGLRELREAFEPIGRVRLSVDGFFGLGVQAADLDMMPPFQAAVIRASEVLRRASGRVPALVRLADSVYVTARRPAGGP
jgi:SAM-dependent methyltransferase